MFTMLGFSGIFFPPMLFFFVFAIAAYNTNTYEYSLKVVTTAGNLQIMRNTSKRKVKSMADTIHGLCFSRKVLTFAST